ncbi:MAG TPA: M20 family metallopeptidase [Streptosporangiaceae bacterium]|nr:M20 family metallopeptidase [Streptosporangiaceae bacterium]
MGLREDAAAIADELAELRHAIHREPEIGLELPLTQARVLDALDGLPLEVSTGRKLSSVTAVLRGGAAPAGGTGSPGGGRPVVLLRGDMDALPVTEATGLPYSSRFDGVMHACGHDQHTAMLAGAARLLGARQAELPGDVIFMFQPGEEGYRGADLMIGEGVLDAAGPRRPAAAYALHVSSTQLPCGVFTTRPGPMLAAADIIRVTVRGRGGHASQPHLAADPITAACAMVTALQTMVTRRFDVFDPVVVTISSFQAGTTDNVIPDEAAFLGTARSYSSAARDRLREEIVRLINDLADAHGVSADAHYVDEYPVTVNDAAEAEFARAVAADVFGVARAVPKAYPMTGAEDFSYVLQQVPGAFISVGAVPLDRDPATAPSNHSAAAVFDDAVLADGSALYAELALRRLGTA